LGLARQLFSVARFGRARQQEQLRSSGGIPFGNGLRRRRRIVLENKYSRTSCKRIRCVGKPAAHSLTSFLRRYRVPFALLLQIESYHVQAHPGSVCGVSVDKNIGVVASCGDDEFIRLWTLENPTFLALIRFRTSFRFFDKVDRFDFW